MCKALGFISSAINNRNKDRNYQIMYRIILRIIILAPGISQMLKHMYLVKAVQLSHSVNEKHSSKRGSALFKVTGHLCKSLRSTAPPEHKSRVEFGRLCGQQKSTQEQL